MEFWKMHGCGNDYIIVDDREETVRDPKEAAREMSNRNFGIGSDGLILIRDSKQADFAMKMYNVDGTEGDMCGNGIRLLAKYVFDNGLTENKEITVETISGVRELELHVKNGKVDYVTVNMGEPVTRAAGIPVESNKETVVEENFDVDGTSYLLTCVGMGNPHAVMFVDDLEETDVAGIGPLLENHVRFPKRTNVEFVQVKNENTIHMKVWERGSGETLACGTGACASVAACILTGRTNDEVTVYLDGGTLKVRYDRKKDQMFLTGPAKLVYKGQYDWK